MQKISTHRGSRTNLSTQRSQLRGERAGRHSPAPDPVKKARREAGEGPARIRSGSHPLVRSPRPSPPDKARSIPMPNKAEASTRSGSEARVKRVEIEAKLPAAAQVARQQLPGSHNHNSQYQTTIRAFEIALRHFQRKKLEKARDMFQKLSGSQFAEVADRARLHLRLCRQRLGRSARAPKTAAEFYLLGVAELNSRVLDLAVEHLAKADRLEPRREDIHYALAAAYALQGRADLALSRLRAAIELRPENAFQARRDQDFEKLAADWRFQALVRSPISHSSAMHPVR